MDKEEEIIKEEEEIKGKSISACTTKEPKGKVEKVLVL